MRNKVTAAHPEWSRTLETLRRQSASQFKLAKKLETSAMTISQWECGQSKPPANAQGFRAVPKP